MKGAVLLTLFLANVPLSVCCRKEGELLVCTSIPSDFPSGGSTLLVFNTNVGEINSTVLLSENLASITRVVMSGVSITKIAEGAFSSFQCLTSLVLDSNLLTEINLKWLGNPTILIELNLSGNQITALNGTMVDGLGSLQKLNLSRNQIRTIDPHTFTSLTVLFELNLSFNKLRRLTPQMFNARPSMNMSLHGNPWDCSCAAEDSIEFIKDLQSRSLLLDSIDVTCTAPPSVKGLPVWSVSVCAPTSPGPPPGTPFQQKTTLATPQYQTMSGPPSDPKTTFVMKTMPPLKDTTPTLSPQPPPADRDIVPMLITVIVVLCVLLFLVILLAVLYKRKRKRQVVATRAQKEPVSGVKSHHEQETTATMGDFHWDTETPCQTSFTGVRAKSANAILFTSPFGGSGKDHVGSSEEKEVEESEKIMDEMVKNKSDLISNAEAIQNPNDNNLSSVNVNSDNFPYLSIGSHQSGTGHNDNQRSKVGQGMHRISTWPPTAVQWQERCKRLKEQKKEEVNGLTTWMQAEGLKVASEAIAVEHISCVYGQDLKKSQEESSQTQDDTIGYESEIHAVELPELNDVLDTTSGSSVSDKTGYSQAHEESQHLRPGGITQKMDVNCDKAQSSGVGSRPREEKSRSGSKALSGGDSPSDMMPLDGALDLLHEVVQNHGRWTRDRWRQIHVNKQPAHR